MSVGMFLLLTTIFFGLSLVAIIFSIAISGQVSAEEAREKGGDVEEY